MDSIATSEISVEVVRGVCSFDYKKQEWRDDSDHVHLVDGEEMYCGADLHTCRPNLIKTTAQPDLARFALATFDSSRFLVWSGFRASAQQVHNALRLDLTAIGRLVFQLQGAGHLVELRHWRRRGAHDDEIGWWSVSALDQAAASRFFDAYRSTILPIDISRVRTSHNDGAYESWVERLASIHGI